MHIVEQHLNRIKRSFTALKSWTCLASRLGRLAVREVNGANTDRLQRFGRRAAASRPLSSSNVALLLFPFDVIKREYWCCIRKHRVTIYAILVCCFIGFTLCGCETTGTSSATAPYTPPLQFSYRLVIPQSPELSPEASQLKDQCEILLDALNNAAASFGAWSSTVNPSNYPTRDAKFAAMLEAKRQLVEKLVELRAAGVTANLQDQDGNNYFSD
jgi:hypothetical protein